MTKVYDNGLALAFWMPISLRVICSVQGLLYTEKRAQSLEKLSSLIKTRKARLQRLEKMAYKDSKSSLTKTRKARLQTGDHCQLEEIWESSIALSNDPKDTCEDGRSKPAGLDDRKALVSFVYQSLRTMMKWFLVAIFGPRANIFMEINFRAFGKGVVSGAVFSWGGLDCWCPRSKI